MMVNTNPEKIMRNILGIQTIKTTKLRRKLRQKNDSEDSEIIYRQAIKELYKFKKMGHMLDFQMEGIQINYDKEYITKENYESLLNLYYKFTGQKWSGYRRPQKDITKQEELDEYSLTEFGTMYDKLTDKHKKYILKLKKGNYIEFPK